MNVDSIVVKAKAEHGSLQPEILLQPAEDDPLTPSSSFADRFEPEQFFAGVDGCRGGWIMVSCRAGRFAEAHVELKTNFADIINDDRALLIAIDMPIGLPELAAKGGRRAERELRACLGPRRASVFSIPARAAVFAHDKGYRAVCAVARQTSTPPWAPSLQAFHIFPHIVEIDTILRAHRIAISRVYEVHPELAFALMNRNDLGEPKPLREPKRKCGRLHAPGLELRRSLLLQQGFGADILDAPLPRGLPKPERDDLYDACATLWTADRIHKGSARAYPADLEYDGFGLPMAIRG